MWPSISALPDASALAFVPLIYWVVFGALMAYDCVRYPLYRNTNSYICLLDCIFGAIPSIISLLAATQRPGVEQSAYFFFYGLYMTFAFLPSLFAFYAREKRTKQSKYGRRTIYFGLLWAAACILGSFSTTIMAALLVNNSYRDADKLRKLLNGGLHFVSLMNWIFLSILFAFVKYYYKFPTQKHA